MATEARAGGPFGVAVDSWEIAMVPAGVAPLPGVAVGRRASGRHRRGPASITFWVMVGLTAAALAALGAELALAYRTPTGTTDARQAAANAALVARFYEDIRTGGPLASVDEVVAVDHVYHDPAVTGVTPGPDGVVRLVAAIRRAFPDGTVAVDDVVAQGDRVVVRFTARGTHHGEVMGRAATGRAAAVTGVAVHRVAYRQIVETWLNWDTYGLARQVGLFLLPAPIDGSWDGAPGPALPGEPH